MAQVLPVPLRFEARQQTVLLPAAVSLSGPDADRVQAALVRVLGKTLRRSAGSSFRVVWELADSHPQLGVDESYQLTVDATGIELRAPSIWGVLHGVTSLGQLVRDGALDECSVVDRPRFPWRGLLLDPSRRFLSAASLRQVLDWMASLKLNVLHLHLTDDQGFRFPVPAFERLASDPHYSKSELLGLVEYASDRGIRLVPEIDMPGHVTSWLVAYPEWGQTVEPSERFGVHDACLDPTREETYSAIRTILTELAEVFPDQYVHIGGDEVRSDVWRSDETIAAFMAAHDLKEPADLQAHFNRRVVTDLAGMGKQVIAWDEVLHADMPEGIVVQNWRGATNRDRALKAGHDCVVSAGYYLDLFYPPEWHAAYDPAAAEAQLVQLEDAMLEDVRFQHVARGMRWTHSWRAERDDLPTDGEGRVLGGEACLWGELVDETVLPWRLGDRLPAIAELLWSEPERIPDDAGARVWPWLDGTDIDAQRRNFLRGLGLGDADIELVDLFEPVKWYARLLGEVALEARLQGSEMPQARPYLATTPLNQMVDGVFAQSRVSMQLLTWDDAAVEQQCQAWLQLAEQSSSQLAATVAEICRVALAGGDAEALLQHYVPHGELIPAIAWALAERQRK